MQTDRDKIVISESGYDIVRWAFDIDGEPVPWSDARLQIRTEPRRSATLLGELSVSNGLITISEETLDEKTVTVVQAVFTEALVATLPPGTWFFDTRLLDTLGHPHYPIAGPIEIPDTVTAPLEEEVPS